MPLPAIVEGGDLPPGLHPATLAEVLARFGQGSKRVSSLPSGKSASTDWPGVTGHMGRLVVFGSFVTDQPEPNDVDVLLLMEDAFDAGRLTGEAQLLFDHAAAQSHFGASVFWMRRLAALGGEQAAIEFWQTNRDGGQRGIVEIVWESP